MRVLVSAYACEPEKGSEPGVGWHWTTELARLGHEVDVITRFNNRASIEKALAADPTTGLQFHYYDLPSWGKWWKRGNRGIQLYYRLWQHGAYRLARRLISKRHYDIVHSLTFGSFRQPSFMGRLGLPFVIGPIGGGDFTPALLRGSYPAIPALREMLREISIKLAYWDPAVRAMYRQATLVFCKTRDTLAILPASCRKKSRVQLEIGLEPHRIRSEVMAKAASADFLYAGRLVYMKGIHLALEAFSELRQDRPDATFTLIGTGPNEAQLKSLSAKLGLRDSVRWLGWIPYEDLWMQFCHYTAFVFPSFHDSSGNVLLEALSQALPAICLDTGGPGEILSPSCGIKIPVKNRSKAEVVGDLAAAMRNLADNPELRDQMGRRALEVSRASIWKDVVSGTYAQIEEAINALNMCHADHPV
jgi:glycosyltransferase involved in cell wall biosynthesis